ncbi:Reduced folate carrier family and Major facilitator superfamily domain, general substrate transporter-containing protein [Strongyloides ratti]|uniref:Reduced folate carrier family and Major facilitator superfamily domain, general substrate transporter-containing protein n=1 Tax=Strongyloides ratti TaxID=34506 RepID=A0A090L149_STRRB|nr:Reduced folate carrier family and Major facilitator superfamily domain, general substrate transporter-containing protein [Strongyloides ratti]CEF61837.2 Reduced folate carrier family and Major facilitator superfamily domain, general substrate transporter-containing protein [Strongyloides ratti]
MTTTYKKGFTKDEIYQNVYPLWAYAHLIFSIPIVLFTDYLNFKPILLIESISLIATGFLLTFGNSLFSIQMTQITYGCATSSEIAFMSYLYTKVYDNEIAFVTGIIRGVILLSKCLCTSIGQLGISLKWFDLTVLNETTLVMSILSLPFVLFAIFPRICFKKDKKKNVNLNNDIGERESLKIYDKINEKKKRVQTLNFIERIKYVKDNLSDPILLIVWSSWWTITSALIYQMYNYIQVHWTPLQLESIHVYNGSVEFINTLLGACVTLSFSRLKINWKKYTGLITIFSTILFSFLFVALAETTNIYISYILYIIINVTYLFLIAIASSILASIVDVNGIGIVFGVVSLTTSLLQSLLGFILINGNIWALNTKQQFSINSLIFLLSSIIFIIISCFNVIINNKKKGEIKEENSTNINIINGRKSKVILQHSESVFKELI